MEKRIAIVLFLLAIFVLITGCKSNNLKGYKLEITESSWSGWSEDYKPEEVTKTYEIEKDKEYKIDNGGLIFTIKEINKDNIVIETKESYSDSKKGIDLRTEKKEFTISIDETTKLTTQTMDAGEIYYLKLVK